LKIALCSDWFYPRIGGVTSHIVGLAIELTKQGHEVQIITTENGVRNCSNSPFSSIYRISVSEVARLVPSSTIVIPPNPAKIREVLQRECFDVVHGHHAFTPTSLLSIQAAKKLGTPTVLTNHTISFAPRKGYFWVPLSFALFPFKMYIGRADRVISVSSAAADFIGHFVDRERIIVVPNGVDIHRFNHVGNDARLAYVSDASKSVPTALYVGRLAYSKGVHVLIRAMPRVLKEVPDAQLLIAGDGLMRGYLEYLIGRLSLNDHVKLLGFIPDEALPKLYHSCDVFVLPSLCCEAFGIALLEAMASGKPIVASRAGGIPEVIRNGVTGVLVNKGDLDSISREVIRLMIDKRFAKTLGQNARRVVETKYSWPIVAAQVESIYEDIQ